MRNIIVFLILFISCATYSQENPPQQIDFRKPDIDTVSVDTSDLRILFKSTDQGLKIRWAPTSPQVWLQGNEVGYTLERLKVDSTSALNFQKLGNFQPLPLADWEPIVSDDRPYTAAAAMAIHGESSESNQGIIPQAQDLENKFGFALLAADLDWNAAVASGLGWLDETAEDATLYVYRIYVNEPSNPSIDTIYDYVVSGDFNDYLPVKLIELTENENEIVLEWEDSPFTPYSAFHVERSLNGADFIRITEQPYIQVTTNLIDKSKAVKYVDSTDVNYLNYYYRIVGLDAFGEESEPSNVMEGMGRDRTSPSAPLRIDATELTPGEMTVTWEWESASIDKDFKGFNVYKSLDYEKGYVQLNEQPLPADTRSFLDSNPDPRETNYYYVAAVDEEGNEGRSVLAFGITKDEIPPGPPTNLRATVDTTGLLLLEWDAPADNDIRGYQVLYSNAGDAEYGARSVDYLPFNYFVDSISLKTLTKNIFYYVIAIDYSYNQSEPSPILEVKRPDIIAPEASIFTNYRVSEEGVYFEWLISSSNDVINVELQRKVADGNWKKVDEFNPGGKSYLDKNVKGGVLYSYQLVTRDESGNQTIPEKPLVLEGLRPFFIADVQNPRAVREDDGLMINWQYEEIDYVEFILYKGISDTDMSTYAKVINEYQLEVPSYDVSENTKFWIKAKSSDGRESQLVPITTL